MSRSGQSVAPALTGYRLERGNQPAPVVAFANQKGGVCKTTTAVNASVILAQRGHRVLLVDMDPQGNATSSLGVPKDDLTLTTYDLLTDGVPVDRAICATHRAGLDLVPAGPVLAGAEVELVGESGRERRLEAALAPVLPH
ncbi:MAG: ParA family protein [Thermomicrobiales bacterium]